MNSAGAPEITDTNNYYPFRLNHTGGNGLNSSNFGSFYSYKYNGKEIQETGMFDYGWRQYMPDLGRWNGIDQLAEAYTSISPFAYVANNPISMRDPDGRWMDEAGHIDTSGQANPFQFLGSSHKPRYMTSSTGVTLNPDSFGDGYSLFDQVKDGLGKQNIFIDFNKKGDMYWWTTYKDPNTGVKGIGTLEMLKLRSYSGMPEIRQQPYSYNAGQKDFDWGHIGNVMIAGGIAYYALEKSIYSSAHWVNAKGIIKSTKLLEKGANGKFVRGVQGLRNGYTAAGKATSAYSIAGKVVGGIGMGVTAIQYLDGQITGLEASVDLTMGAIGFTGWGAPISLAYFGGKFLYEYSTGESLFPKPGEN